MTSSVEDMRKRLHRAKLSAIHSERRRLIKCIEGVIGHKIADGGQYRADVAAALRGWRDAAFRAGHAEGREAGLYEASLLREPAKIIGPAWRGSRIPACPADFAEAIEEYLSLAESVSE